jgi:hypothetical protein
MTILNKAAARAHGAIDEVVEGAAPAAEWLEQQGETLTVGGEKFADSAARFVAAHPLQSLGLALAAGYLLSRITR